MIIPMLKSEKAKKDSNQASMDADGLILNDAHLYILDDSRWNTLDSRIFRNFTDMRSSNDLI